MEQKFLSIPECSHENSAEKSRRLSGLLTKKIWKGSQETIASIYGVYARVNDGRILKLRDVSGSVPTREGRTLHHEKFVRKEEEEETNFEINFNSNQSSNDQAPTKSYVRATIIALFSWKAAILSRFTIVNFLLGLGGITLHFIDLILDWVNAFGYLDRLTAEEDSLFYFGLTVAAIIFPSFIMHTFSAWWEVEDFQYNKIEKRKRQISHRSNPCWYFCIVMSHILQIAPVYRYSRALYYGVKSRQQEVMGHMNWWKFYDDLFLTELYDINFMRMTEAFLESSPQLILQFYIMIELQTVPAITVIFCLASMSGIALAFIGQEMSQRDMIKGKRQLSILGILALGFYRGLTMSSRILSHALLLHINVLAWIVFFFTHWLFFSLLTMWRKTKFCPTKLREYAYDIVIGFCLNFGYLNVHPQSKHRHPMMIYYFCMLVENIAICLLWFYIRDGGGNILETLKLYFQPKFITLETSNITKSNQTIHMSGENVKPPIPNDIALLLVFAVIISNVIGLTVVPIYYFVLRPATRHICACLRLSHYSSNQDNEVISTNELLDEPGQPSTTSTADFESVYITVSEAVDKRGFNSCPASLVSRKKKLKISPAPDIVMQKTLESTFSLNNVPQRSLSLPDCTRLKGTAHSCCAANFKPLQKNMQNVDDEFNSISSPKPEYIEESKKIHLYKTKKIRNFHQNKNRSIHSDKTLSVKRDKSFTNVAGRNVFNRSLRASTLYSRHYSTKVGLRFVGQLAANLVTTIQ
ncbi:uncharacterized protein LOC143449384 [Clavelina lepadiformis]|uniref:uncharacterized protein LOC143449384 n=1 Tax=Clavelina lepadiformis TaxID=159417 RepID=UPI004042FE68